MGKMIECHKLNPTSECDHIVRGENEREVMRNAREHGLEPTPELMAQVRSHMEDEAERD